MLIRTNCLETKAIYCMKPPLWVPYYNAYAHAYDRLFKGDGMIFNSVSPMLHLYWMTVT